MSGGTSERCDNARDDDCDGEIDESDCTAPNTIGAVARRNQRGGTYELTTVGAALDYPVSCIEQSDAAGFRDVVLAIEVPAGEARDVSLVATSDDADLLLAAADRCGKADAETACQLGTDLGARGQVARLLLHGVEPGAHAVYLATSVEATAQVRLDFRDATPPPEHETCGTAAPLTPDEPVRAILSGLATDLESACDSVTGELVTDSTRRAKAYGASLARDDFGEARLSLRKQIQRRNHS